MDRRYFYDRKRRQKKTTDMPWEYSKTRTQHWRYMTDRGWVGHQTPREAYVRYRTVRRPWMPKRIIEQA